MKHTFGTIFVALAALVSSVRAEPTRFPVLTNEEAWQHLPPTADGKHPPLPVWARALAKSLPQTTAKMLDLDYAQRTQSPLHPVLRAQLRFVAAEANQCSYAKSYAEFDLVQIGGNIGPSSRADSLRDRAAAEPAIAFVRKLTRDAYAVTDADVARMIELFGEKKVVALVALAAYANFQDRLLLTLNLPVEEGGPLPPLKINWEPPDAKGPPAPPPFPGPPRLVPSPPDETVPASIMADEWLALDAAKLIESLSQQKDRPGRIRVPTWDEVKKNAPPGYPTDRPTRIKWSLVCMGHLPELTAPWLTCMRTFGRESDQNRIFEESMFWVITRSLHCYY